MACVPRGVRTAQVTQMFPNEVSTEQESMVVVKKLLAIAVSSITYLRGLFPEKAYGSKDVEGQKVMILREDHKFPAACQIVKWMHGCFDALQKKYLRTIILTIYTDPENPQKVTEVYQFRIKYTSEGPQLDIENNNNNKVSAVKCSNTKKASILLLRKLCTLMQILGPLPDIVCLNMKLAYYEEVTPQSYQPPGFKEGNSDVMEFEREPVKLMIGEVISPFHTLKVNMATERDRMEQVEDEPLGLRDNWLLKVAEESDGSQSHMIEDVEKPDDGNLLMDTTKVRSEVQVSCHKRVEVNEEGQVDSQMDTLVKETSDMAVGLRSTRRGRVTRSTMRKIRANKKSSPIQDKKMSQFEFPDSQEVPSSAAPKRRKFSEPKDRY
ncbi:HORMA domain-containing protein 1 [Myripristis murdjan]|uniref:HORMA domain-containing protein 1 n=1 Tax=Myripristis murdjan TaxID=586833 RepID=UPI001175F2B7|nr:HORMA domain-containing protein 1-like [Myripristis murdjan]